VTYPSFFQAMTQSLSTPDGSVLVDLAGAALADQPAGSWRRSFDDDMWCHLRPVAAPPRDQGWKLHVSATAGCAPEVLRRSLAVLVPAGCPLKFATTVDRLDLLNSAHYPRGGAGKFITAYPRDDDQFRQLVARLDEETDGLAGPRILSDRPYRPGSLVHYRYGGFVRRQKLSNDAEQVLLIAEPDGQLVRDRRDAWFDPPSWVPEPFPEVGAAAVAAPKRPAQVLLNGRFAAREAIRHSNRGGVYRAAEVATGAEVIVKQARFGVLGNAAVDAQVALRREAETLDAFASLGIAPAGLALFEQGGDLFLAQELVEGEPLRLWVRRHAHVIGATTPAHAGVPWPLLSEVLARLVDVIDAAHTAGWVLRDLTPSNVMVTRSGTVRLIDLESAARIGDIAPAAGTPGYVAPELSSGAPAAVSADLYGLGAIVFMMAAGVDPLFAGWQGHHGPARMAEWLDLLAGERDAGPAAIVRPIVLGLTAGQPDQRWSLARVRCHLPTAATRPIAASRPDAPAGRRSAPGWERLIADGLDYLRTSVSPWPTAPPRSPDRLWPAACTVGSVDTCNVQHGSAGVIAVLARAIRYGVAEACPDLTRMAMGWTMDRLRNESAPLPGLHFGRSGTAWALHEAGVVLAEPDVTRAALDLALAVPVRWPNPDVAHGAAGAGLAQLRFWQATGVSEFRDRIVECAEAVAAHAIRRDGELLWPIPATFESRLAGAAHYGFAHGVAGIGYFLLSAGCATGRQDFLDLAVEAGQTLCTAAVCDDAGALWPTNAGDPVDPVEHWCSGSSGVGTFLIRLWEMTGDLRHRGLAEAAAHAVWRRRWYASPVSCHGLAGNGEFLLDMAEATGDVRYRDQAVRFAELIDAQHTVRDGRRLVPDETRVGFGVEYGVGLSGVLDFLLRLRHDGPRSWFGPLLPPDHRGGRSTH
jgi:serine/threonine protein kinase